MRAGGGKEKGSSFERKVGEKISLWLSKGLRKDLLCRTVGSGAQFTSSNRGLPGDLRAQDSVEAFNFCSKFVIECKHWSNLDFDNFLLKKGELYKALIKVKQEGITAKKSYWFVVKRNNRPEWVMTPVFMPMIESHHLFDGAVYLYKLDQVIKDILPENL